MMGEWEIVRLGDVCKTGAGGTPRKSIKEYYEGGDIPWILSGEVSQRDICTAQNYITSNGLSNSSAKVFPRNTVLVAMYGATAGQVGILRFEAATNQAVCGIFPGEQFIPEFLYYVFVHEKEDLVARAVGNAQPNLSQIKIKDTLVPLPPLDEQKRIVAILDETFDAIDTAIANAERNLVNAREVFESQLGVAFSAEQQGWTTKPLGDICSFTGGSQPPKSEFSTTRLPGYVRLIQIRDYKSDKHKVYVSEDKVRRFCSPDDVMIGRYGPPLFQILRGLEGAYNVALMKAEPDERYVTKDFLYFFLQNGEILQYIINASNRAAGQIGVNKATLNPYPVSFPSIELQHDVVTKLEKLQDFCEQLESIYQRKLDLLTELKQSILHKAFSGQLTASRGNVEREMSSSMVEAGL